MSKRVYVIHGWGGSPEGGWLSWLKYELGKKGFEAEALAMPDTNEPKIEKWVPHLEKHVGKPDEETYLVGHSIGCQTILRYLDGLPEESKIGGAVFVAGFFELKNLNTEEYEAARPWLAKNIDFKKVKKHTKNFTAIFSDNDHLVPLSSATVFEKELEAKVIIMNNKGHFCGEDGSIDLPIVLDEILRMSEK